MTIFEEIKKIIKDKTGKEVKIDSNLRDLGIDSLDLLDFIVEAETKLNVQINDEELMSLQTIGDVVKALENKVK